MKKNTRLLSLATAIIATTTPSAFSLDVDGDLNITDPNGTSSPVEFASLQFEEGSTNTFSFWQSTVGEWVWDYGGGYKTMMHLADDHSLSLHHSGSSNAPVIELIPGDGTTTPSIKIDGLDVLTAADYSNNNFLQLSNQSVFAGSSTSTSGTKNVNFGDSTSTAGSATAVGWNATAGANSVAIGLETEAATDPAHQLATAVGNRARATHYASAFGDQTRADGAFSLAAGHKAYALGYTSTALGGGTRSLGDYSIAIGNNALAGAIPADPNNPTASTIPSSIAVGRLTQATGSYSIAIGQSAIASSTQNVAIGVNSKAGDETNLGQSYHTTTVGNHSKARGLKSSAFGSFANANGWWSVALGPHSEATANRGVAIGLYADAASSGSTALGAYAKATGQAATAIGGAHNNTDGANGLGPLASGHFSNAFGRLARSIGDYSVAFPNANASSHYSFAIGFNEDRSTNSTAWVADDLNSILEIGIGTSDTDRKNALTVLKDGSVEIGKATETDDSVPLKVLADGSVILSRAQGDISMGIYAPQN